MTSAWRCMKRYRYATHSLGAQMSGERDLMLQPTALWRVRRAGVCSVGNEGGQSICDRSLSVLSRQYRLISFTAICFATSSPGWRHLYRYCDCRYPQRDSVHAQASAGFRGGCIDSPISPVAGLLQSRRVRERYVTGGIIPPRSRSSIMASISIVLSQPPRVACRLALRWDGEIPSYGSR
jgi:hypothetical protein